MQENAPPPAEYEFFVEESVLKFCFVGMKVDTSIWKLNCGLYYFDKTFAVHCSFYTVLLNEYMIGWKEPKDLRDTSAQNENREENDELELSGGEGEGGSEQPSHSLVEQCAHPVAAN